MSKIYKSTWYNSDKQWVAISEVSSKSKNKNSFLCKMILSGALAATGISTGSLTYAGVINNATDINTTVVGDYPISDIVTDGSNTVIDNTGSLSTQGANTNSIYVNNTTGQTVITNTGDVSTHGNTANVIEAKSSTGNITIENTGNITATGTGSTGILATTANGTITINDLGNHTITATGSGIHLQAGNTTSTAGEANITTNAKIIVDSGNSTTTNYVSGIDVTAANSNSSVNYDGPGISVTSGTTNTTANIVGIRSASGLATATGNVDVTASGNIDVNLNNGKAHLIYGIESLNMGTGDATVHYKSGAINVNANGSTVDFGRGLLAQSTGAASSGSAKIVTDEGTEIHTIGDYVDAIGLTSANGTATDGKVVFADINSTITTDGKGAYGIRAVAGKDALIDVTNRGSITTKQDNSHAISLTSSSGKIEAVNTGNISTLGASSIGILATNNGAKATHIYNAGTIETSGSFGFGIQAIANAKGNIDITNNGQVITNDASGHGIYAYRGASGGDVTINNNGLVHITGSSDSRAILVSDNSNDASTITINNTGTIIHDIEANGHYGIDALVKNNASVVVNNSGSISGGQFGIVVWSGNAPNTNSQGIINIDSTGRIDSGNALTMDLSNSNTMNIAEGAVVNGWRNALLFRTDSAVTPVNTVNNAGTITSEIDKLLSTRYQSAGVETTINNAVTGNMSGFITADKTDVTVNNAGLWNLRNFADSTGDHIRDTKAVAISNFGNGTNTVNNTGILNLAAVSGETSTDTTGEYVPIGALSIANAGTVQGQMLNLNTFENSGLIDMTANNQAGDVLVITGGATAGTNGGGTFISNGGSLKMNTLLNQGDSASLTDVLVLDNVQVGANGATKVYITPTAGSLGQYTLGDGIQIVKTLGTQDSNAFALGKPLVSGAYEYLLYPNSMAGNTDGFYLRSHYLNTPLYNPAMGAYLANQTAAVQMFQQTLFDRLISSSDGKNNDASKSLFWMRTKMTHGSYDSIHGSLNNRTRSYTLQMGGDLNVWALDNGGYFHLGMMGGYGDFKDTSKSELTRTKTDGKVKGYSAGIYGTYFANQDTNLGLYVDLWSQMGWYRNEVSGKAQISTKKYDSSVWSNSVEVGYGIPLAISGEYQWLATPQAQFTYNYYDADNQYDKNNLRITNNNASGLDTRLGVRFHARGVQEDLIEPFLEVNWLDTTAKNKLNFNGKAFKDGFAKDRLEAKVGLQGNINKRWSMSAQMGGQWGNNSFSNYQGQLNVNYKF